MTTIKAGGPKFDTAKTRRSQEIAKIHKDAPSVNGPFTIMLFVFAVLWGFWTFIIATNWLHGIVGLIFYSFGVGVVTYEQLGANALVAIMFLVAAIASQNHRAVKRSEHIAREIEKLD